MRPIAAVAVTALLAACATSSATPRSTPAPATSTAATAAPVAATPAAGAPMSVVIPDGTYATTITRADAPSGMSMGMADTIAGTWTIAFSGFHFVARLNGAEVVSSDYHSIGNQQVHFPVDDVGPMACHMDGVYRVTVANHQLSYEKVRDECTGRVMVLTARPLAMTM